MEEEEMFQFLTDFNVIFDRANCVNGSDHTAVSIPNGL